VLHQGLFDLDRIDVEAAADESGALFDPVPGFRIVRNRATGMMKACTGPGACREEKQVH
jgi:hypothetical protein